MNVVENGILEMLAMATFAITAIAPLLLAALQRQMVAAVVASGRPPRWHSPIGVFALETHQARIPTDIVPAHQAWRAPPTVWALDSTDDPADVLGRRSD